MRPTVRRRLTVAALFVVTCGISTPLAAYGVFLPVLAEAFGSGFAAADTMIAKVIPDVFGVRAIGAIMGVLTLGWRSGAALGPAAAGFLYDVSGLYAVPFGAAPGVVLVSWALFAVATSRRARG